MARSFEIHPRVGVARLGNSPDFYLAPETVGGLPVEWDPEGSAVGDSQDFVQRFKDGVGRVKRQAARFRIFERVDGDLVERALGADDVESIEWTVHVANKKPIWYTFSELQGDLEFGEGNSYENQHVPVNNPDTTEPAERQALIIDPGPRSIDAPDQVVEISRYNIPDSYKHGSFPPVGAGGQQIDTLGELRMDERGALIALGGFGNVTGSAQIDSFRGAPGYWDDIADGFVFATVTLTDGTEIVAAPSWLLVGSPKYAPELVNITTLHDTMYDVAIRRMNLDPAIYPGGQQNDASSYDPLVGYDPDYEVDFETQVRPIFERIQGYRWVADIPYLADYANPDFDVADPSEELLEKRRRYFRNFRVPLLAEDYDVWAGRVENGPDQLFSADGIPLLPLNSGDNSVTNQGPIYKFETLSPTQYFFLRQWSEGKFRVGEPPATGAAEQLDGADTGNCVGAPFSPGIETTWIVRNAPIYWQPFQVKLAHYEEGLKNLERYYRDNGLSTTADEAHGQGCEPGDLTKRMAIPWQADFSECTVQTPNITNRSINQMADGTGIEVPPAYYVYWWPPQSPMHVVSGALDPGDQVLDGIVSSVDGLPIIAAGQRVLYQRGILNAADVISYWSELGFVVNRSQSEDYPYFVETERGFRVFGQLTALQQAQRVASVQNK